MEGEIRERAIQVIKVIGSLECVMRKRTVSREVKKALRDSIIVLTVPYASKTWVWNQSQRSKIQAAEISYMRGGCGVNRMDGESFFFFFFFYNTGVSFRAQKKVQQKIFYVQ